MRCNPLRWLWGLLPLAVWLWLAVLGERPRIEADLAKRTHDALNAAGYTWASVNFTGRDGVLMGRAQEEQEPAKALEVARAVPGVRVVHAQTDLIEKVETYLWSASTRDGSSIRLSGYVPNESTRKTIAGLLKASFPKSELEDRMKLARGAPAIDTWLGGVGFAAKQLAFLKKGHVELSGTDLSIAGEAQSVSAYQNIAAALRKLPQGIHLSSNKVTPPVISPYVWSAVRDGSEVVLSGYVPSDKAREDVVAHAGKLFGKVADKMQLADGAPDHLVRGLMTTLDQLARLNSGRAELKANQLSLMGDAGDEASAESIRKAWKSALPGSLKTSDAIMYSKPAEPSAEELTARKAAEEQAARKAADEEAARKAAEAKRHADEEAAKKAAEAKRHADEEAAKRAAEAKRHADEEAAKKAAEAKRLADEEAAKKAAATKRSQEEEAARKAAEAKRAAEEAEARKAAEAKRVADEAAARDRQRIAATPPEQRKAEAAKCQETLAKLAKEGTITFERASADLHSDSTVTLGKLAKAVNACPGYVVEVEGHTDAEGTPERNLRLSERRAQSVADYLTKAGVAAARLKAIGYGETRPVAPNDTPDNRAKNRRIEFGVKAD